MKFELIGSSNLYDEIKAQVSRQRAVFPELPIIVALELELLHCPVDAMVIHLSINLPPPPMPSQDIHDILEQGICKCDYLQDLKKESFSICICNTFLELL